MSIVDDKKQLDGISENQTTQNGGVLVDTIKVDASNEEILNDSNNNSANSTSDQPQIILQTDEIITVVVSEKSNEICREIHITEEELKDIQSESANCADKNFPKSILTNNNNFNSEEKRSSLLRKKSVSFEANEEARKFIAGEEIIDKQNPFKNDSDNISDKYRIIKGKKTSIPVKSAPLASEESDFITKEEILKQSKYVPVYIKNPDKVLKPLTFPKPVLEKKVTSDKTKVNNGNPNDSKKIPVPLPRKTSSTKTEKKEKKRGRVRNPKYPDLSDIKVKTGTDLNESLYDHNEVVLNAKKFDSRFKRLQFGSTDDLEEIVDKEETSITVEERSANGDVETIKTEEKKSYTNTVNSEEFRQYLKKKGLVLFPIKTNNAGSTSNGSAKNNNILRQIDETDMSDMDDRRKKSVFSRLSSIFTSSKGKTTPKTNEPLSRLSYSNKTDNNLGSNIKRVILERNNGDNRSVSANSEFMQHFSSIDTKKHRNSNDDRSDDNKSSISSVLTAAADDDDEDVNTPVIVRRNNMQNGGLSSLYKNIDVSKSRLYQSKVKQNAEPHSYVMNNGNSVKESEDIIKPKVQRPQSNNSSLRQNSNKSLIKPPVPLRRSTERQSMPAMRSGERYKPLAAERKIEKNLIPKTPNGSTLPSSDKIKNTSTPSDDKAKMKSPTISPIATSQKPSEIDPITFAKIHEIKKKTDEMLTKSSQLYVRPTDIKVQNNLRLNTSQNYFARNSPQRSTITEVYQNRFENNPSKTLKQQQLTRDDYGYANSLLVSTRRSQPQQPPRSQSVMDNMTSSKYSLYDEVKYRRPDGSNVNVMMRRPESTTMDRNHVMQKIYEYYRKSVNNTPVPFHEQQRNMEHASPVSYASVNTMRSMKNSQNGFIVPSRNSDYSIDRKGNYFYTSRPSTMSSTKSDVARNHTISETDSVFLPENEGGGRNQIKNDTQFVVVNGEKLRPIDVLKMQQQYKDKRMGALYTESDRIYDVVYGGTRKENETYGSINRSQQKNIQRPASAMGGSIFHQKQNVMGRMTPLILQKPLPQFQARQGDIIIDNQIYRPIAAIPNSMMSPQIAQPQQIPPQPIYSTPTRRKTATSYESDSEAGEIQSIMAQKYEEDYQNEKSSRNQQNEQVVDDRRRSSGRQREDPRRHTLGTEMMHYANQAGNMQRSMDLEMGQPQKSRKGGMPIRAYTPQHQGPLFDDDPGIMSEVETASTGIRRGGKARSSLPVVRTPSKTLERPLGLVFLQYRSETKRALLPNEITSIDTVRALFVRSFPRQLSMAYLEGPNVKIYIHDSSKDMFYELEDVRSHLREIRDRSVLRLFESNEVAAPQVLPGGQGVPQPLPQGGHHWDQDPSYFSEPEFDSEYQHQHIHKSKTGKAAPYYVGAAQTLPRGHVYSDQSKGSIGVPAKPIRSYGTRGSMQFSYPNDQLYSIPDGYMSSPERGTRAYEEPYYTQYGTRGSVTPIIDEEQSDSMLIDDQYALYGGMKRISRNPSQIYDPARPEDLHRIRVEQMERQLANLTGLVQKALVHNPQIAPSVQQQPYVPSGGQYRDKSVSFEKSVSFSDDIQGVPKAHSPQHMADSKPTKPAIKSSTLPRTSSQERDRLKPAPPMKQNSLSNQYQHLTLAPEVYNHLRGLQKKTKDLKSEVKTLRRLAQSQAIAVREDIKDTFMRIRATLLASNGSHWGQNDQERTRISREEEIYKQEVIRLEKDLADLEGSVEVLRGEVINRRTRVNMAAVEDMALILSRASKTVAELKMRFPNLQQNLRNILSTEMDRVCREEKFLKEEPDRLEIALRRCKKLTGTLVTLKRLASVQEQRTCADTVTEESSPRSASETTNNTNKTTFQFKETPPTPPPQNLSQIPFPSPRMGGSTSLGGIAPENALDALLDELQTFAKPPNDQIRPEESTTSDEGSQILQNTVTTKLSQSQLYPDSSSAHQLRRLHSYPSGSDTEESPPRPPLSTKPPVPERNSELIRGVKGKKVPPPPPPRTSSRSPLASPTSPNVNNRMEQNSDQFINNLNNNNNNINQDADSGSESANSQDNNSQRQLQLEMRHQELLKKQKALQEQYQRLQQMSKNAIPLGHNNDGSQLNNNADKVNDNIPQPQTTVTTNKVYETDIL